MRGVLSTGKVVLMGMVLVRVMPVALPLAVIVIEAENLLVNKAIGVAGAVIMALMVALATVMPMAASCGIGAGLRQKGAVASLQLQAPLLQQIGQHRIFDQPQLAGPHLQRHMTVSEVISRPQQIERLGATHEHQGLSSGLHPHRRIAGRPAEPFARLQRLTPIQLQHQITTADAAAMAAQSGAVIGREGQPQRRLRSTKRGRGGAPGEGERPECGFKQGGWLPTA